MSLVNEFGALSLEETQQLILSALGEIDSGEKELSHHVVDVTAAGDTTLLTPAAGKAIRVRWIYAINDPAATSPRKIKIRFAENADFLNVFAISKRLVKTGGVDEALNINLNGAGDVAVTIIYEEITP